MEPIPSGKVHLSDRHSPQEEKDANDFCRDRNETSTHCVATPANEKAVEQEGEREYQGV